MINVTTGDIDINMQISNDLENWEDISGGNTLANQGVGYGKFSNSGIAAQYVRLRFSHTEDGKSVVAAGVNTANL